MRKTLSLLFVLLGLLISSTTQAQDSAFHARLYYTCKAWGHVKYFHPAVAKGEIDWDLALLNAVPRLKSATNTHDFQQVLQALLLSAGNITTSESSKPTVPDSLDLNPDLSWMYHPIFTPEAQNYLQAIWDSAGFVDHVKVDKQWLKGPPEFENDRSHSPSGSYPDEAHRVLALFRYWNIIHYFFPYKSLMDVPWDSTLLEFTPPVVSASNAEAYQLSMKALTTRIDDSHAFFISDYYNTWRGWYYTPFDAQFIADTLVVTKTLGDASEIHVGDIILSMDGQTIEDLISYYWPYAEGSNPTIKYRTIKDLILFGPSGEASITLHTEQGPKTVRETRGSNHYSDLRTSSSPAYFSEVVNNCRIGRIDMGKLTTEQIPQMMHDFRRKDVLIFDIRNYPNGTFWTLVDYLFTQPITIARFTTPYPNFAGRMFWEQATIGTGTQTPFEGRIILLFNEETQSQAEYTVMGLEQFPGAIKVGSTTSGADGNIAYIFLPGGIQTAATFLGVFYPDYTPTQRVGIIPDVWVSPSPEGLRAGRDEVLEAAYEVARLGGCLTTSFTGSQDSYGITVYPNPMAEILHYSLPDPFDNSPIQLTLTDARGSIVLQRQQGTLSGTLSVAHLAPGEYMLQVQQGRHIAHKLVYKR